MNRRTFLLAASAGGLAPGIALGSPFAPANAGTVVAHSYVTGEWPASALRAMARLRVGDRLQLTHSPTPFDARTVEVWSQDGCLGALPGTDARLVAGLLDAGVVLHAEVQAISHNAPKRKVHVTLALSDIN